MISEAEKKYYQEILQFLKVASRFKSLPVTGVKDKSHLGKWFFVSEVFSYHKYRTNIHSVFLGVILSVGEIPKDK